MSLAVLALGGLAGWSALVTTRGASELARSSGQITGHMNTMQALFDITTELTQQEVKVTDEGLARVRATVATIPRELARMEAGDSAEMTRIARKVEPLARQLGPAIERYLADPRGDILYKGEADDDAAEFAMEKVIDEMDFLLYNTQADPNQLLSDRLNSVRDAGETVGRAAVVLVPLGLGGVIVCAWLLRVYRRRSEATMQFALDATAREARTDPLTGLPNRRAVLEELNRRVDAGETFSFALADLNGFKHYNDTFGHPAGDALLRRLGHKLSIAWEGHGYAARLGGDEFCVVGDSLPHDQLQALLHEALSEEGEGFRVSAVSGVADVPAEATDPSAALSLADTRMYAAKATFHAADRHLPGRAALAPGEPGVSRLVTAPVPDESYPDLGNEVDRTAQLAVMCAATLDLPADQILIIERAAQLHDIGKAALPVAILAKRDALTEEEQRFIRRHTAIGERLVNSASDLAPVAAIVRASQERWDGDGYPDQLAGELIPIGSRIIAVTAAFCAMTIDRPHAAARSIDDALTELNRCSGTQFDPTVVSAFIGTVSRVTDEDHALAALAAPMS
jgi:diguanylate cyclase (GGDEF)-like protein